MYTYAYTYIYIFAYTCVMSENLPGPILQMNFAGNVWVLLMSSRKGPARLWETKQRPFSVLLRVQGFKDGVLGPNHNSNNDNNSNID